MKGKMATKSSEVQRQFEAGDIYKALLVVFPLMAQRRMLIQACHTDTEGLAIT